MEDDLPNDRRISGGAVAAAWSLVAGLAAMTLVGSAMAPTRSIQLLLTEKPALDAGACTSDDATEQVSDDWRHE